MALTASLPELPVTDWTTGIEALSSDNAPIDARRDLTLCFVCMQWSCDGPHCHREGICPPEDR